MLWISSRPWCKLSGRRLPQRTVHFQVKAATTFKNTQLKNKHALTWIYPRAETRLWGVIFFVSIKFLNLFTCGAALQPLQPSRPADSGASFRSKVNPPKWSLKIFPRVFSHTCVWLRWDFNTSACKSAARTAQDFHFAGLCHFLL